MLSGVIGDISNSTVGSQLITNLQEWYKKIEDINKEIESTKALNNSIVTDWFVYDWPEYPPLIDRNKIKQIQFEIEKEVTNMQAIPLINIKP